MDKTADKVSPFKTFIRKVISVFKVLLGVSVLGFSFLFGMALQANISRIHHNSQNLCYVEDAVVVACMRVEDEDYYIWKIIAVRNEGTLLEEVIKIEHRISKVQPLLLGY